MEFTKQYYGPESPAGLRWSQGAKNPRKENQTFIGTTSSGMLFSDTTCQDMEIDANTSGEIHTDSDTTMNDNKVRYKESNKFKPKKNIHKKKQSEKKPSLQQLLIRKESNQKSKKQVFWSLKKLRSRHSSYQKMMSDPLIVAFLDYGTRKGFISETLANNVIKEITKLILQADNITPKFQKFSYESGLLLITCYDYDTVCWLKTKFRYFSKIWDGTDFLIINKHNFENPKMCWAFVPPPIKPSGTIIKLLRAQNLLLSWGRLEIWKKEVYMDEVGLECMFPIGSHMMKKLELLDMKPYCGLSRAQFTFWSDIESTDFNQIKPRHSFNRKSNKPKIRWVVPSSSTLGSRCKSPLLKSSNTLKNTSTIQSPSHSVPPSETLKVRTFLSEPQQQTPPPISNSESNISTQEVPQSSGSVTQFSQHYEPLIPEPYTKPVNSMAQESMLCSNSLVDQQQEQPQAFLLPPQLAEISQLFQYFLVNNILTPEAAQYYQSLLYYQPSNILTLWQSFVQHNNLLLQQQYQQLGSTNFYANNSSFYPYSSQNVQNSNNPVVTQNVHVPLPTGSIQTLNEPGQVFQPPLPDSSQLVHQIQPLQPANYSPTIIIKSEIPEEVSQPTVTSSSDITKKLNMSECSSKNSESFKPPDSSQQCSIITQPGSPLISPPDQSTIAEKLVTSEHFKSTLISEIARNVNLLDYNECPKVSEDSVISLSSDDSKSSDKPEVLKRKTTTKHSGFSSSLRSSKKTESSEKHLSAKSYNPLISKNSYFVKEFDFSKYFSTKSSKTSKHHRSGKSSEPSSLEFSESDFTKHSYSIKKSKSSKHSRKRKSDLVSPKHSKHFSKSSKHSRRTKSSAEHDHASSSHLLSPIPVQKEPLDLLGSPISSGSDDLGENNAEILDNLDPYNPF